MTTVPLKLGEWNVGAGSHASVTGKVLSLFDDEDCAAVGVVETGDRDPVKTKLVASGKEYLEGTESGAQQVGLVTDPKRLKRISDMFQIKVGERTDVGDAGAGPSILHAKYVVGARYLDLQSNQELTLAVKHVVPTVTLPVRHALAKKDLELTADWALTVKGQLILMGDMNMVPSNPLMQPLRDSLLVCGHDIFGEVGTLGQDGHERPADQMWWFPYKDWKPVGHHVVNLSSWDHDALITEWKVTVKPTPAPAPKPSREVTPNQIKAAEDFGLFNVPEIVTAAKEAGVPFHVACALFEKESKGQNVWGNDQGGVFQELPPQFTVTQSTYEVFEYYVLKLKRTSNGVGPAQLTWPGFFTDMRNRNMKPWAVYDNMLYGLELLHDYKAKNNATWETAGTDYNGNKSYGIDFAQKVREWRTRLNG